MFENFSKEALIVISHADEEARLSGHNFIGTEQILIGLVRERSGLAGSILSQLNVTVENTRKEVEKIIGKGSGFVAVNVPLTPRTKRVYERAVELQRLHKSQWVQGEHLLLAILGEGEGVAVRVLENMELDLAGLQSELISKIGGSPMAAWYFPDSSACPNCAEPVKSGARVCCGCKYGISDEHFESCRFCRERIRKGALKCHYCKSSFAESDSSGSGSV